MIDTPLGGGGNKSQRALQWIRGQITSGAYGPGYRLVLSSLAAELGTSVVPVREALRVLTAEGLVEFEPHIGARVAMVDAARYRETMQAIAVIESAATALSASHLTADDLARARSINEMMRTGLGDLDARLFSALNQQFHHVLYARCPNPRLLEMVEVEWARLGRLRESVFTANPGRAPLSVCEHDDLIDLIEAGASTHDVEQAVRRHRSGSLAAFLTHQSPHQVADTTFAEGA
jgi:DNA-binding GntR family transcriptional regulator